MADNWNDEELGIQNGQFSPIVEGGFVHVDGETHILNYDTNVLSLDQDRQATEVATAADEDQPQSSYYDSEEEEDVELSPDGILDEETIGRGMSNLGRSADGSQQVYLHTAIPGFSLKDISILANYIHLQKIEMPYNEITDLSPLNDLKYLLILDASHNKISKLLDFSPPKNLQQVDLSYNEIEEMTDLTPHHYLMSLVLDHNKLKEIKGLENCKRITKLSLAHNKIDKIQGLDNLPIQQLDLSHNHLKKIENIETLDRLRTINLCGNNIRSLKGLEDHDLMECIDVEDNEVIDITEIKFVKGLRMLRQLNLLRNPIQELPDYRLCILFRLQNLTQLDRHKVEVEEKVAAANMFNPPLEVIASRDHIMHVVYQFLQPSRVWDSTLPSVETPYPMLVLVGPQGSGKKDLAMKLVDEFGDYFGYGISHTTRRPHQEEKMGQDYHYVTLEKFEYDIKMGQFIQTYQYNSNWYGLQMESVECVAREGLACVVHMELEGVLTLKNTYFEPRYVLIMPLSKDSHEKRLRDRGIYTDAQMDYTLKRSDMYLEYNQEHPGFFDMMINSDDIQEAYRRLRRLVTDYLGISLTSEQSESGDEEETVVEGQQTQMGTRTWSKPSLPDSLSQPYTRGKTQSPVQSGRGILEEMSIKRRHSAARDAVSGYIPPLFEQITTQYPKTAPQTVEGQVGLNVSGDLRSFSAPVEKPLQTGEEEDSSSDDESDSTLSVASAGDMKSNSPDGSLHDGKGFNLPTDSVNPINLMDGKGTKKDLPPPLQRPPSQGRPGSEKHNVLPPIHPVKAGY
ncbi:leucine-rich repeat and guanylate kinase domain-containing protein-like [Mytilus californianus]|uniref:leucine-rich repeat and guanylate kinase domain-containing protein-like n=1 Tax=Mytilus californianus TaxID=6549 RepID=UPI0022472E9C|nr:leucine-rich repeat and guanylate kinase domain-containing protein-like [Mytilus californianus]